MPSVSVIDSDDSIATYSAAMKAAEAEYLISVLEACACNKTKAAEVAGLTYDTFCRKVKALNLRFKVVQGD